MNEPYFICLFEVYSGHAYQYTDFCNENLNDLGYGINPYSSHHYVGYGHGYHGGYGGYPYYGGYYGGGFYPYGGYYGYGAYPYPAFY